MLGSSMQSFVVRFSAALTVMTLAGCAENYASVEIRQFMVAQADPMNPSACTVNPDPGGIKLLSSVLDVALRDNYVAFALVQNNLFQTRNGDRNRPDQRSIFGESVEVELTTLDGMTLLTLPGAPSTYSVPVRSDIINAGTGGSPGYGVLEIPVITAAQGRALRERLGCTGFAPGAPPAAFCANDAITVRVTLRPTFRTVGGDTLTALRSATWKNVAPYTFPLTVCCGCLLQIPQGLDATCQAPMGSTMTGQQLSYCIAGQDFATPCTVCATRPECQRAGCS
jgi:hypothetical protein